MEQDIRKLKGWYSRRVSLYEELLECIKRERDNLINQDIKGIWNSLEEKKCILESIEEINKLFSEDTEKQKVFNDIHQKDRDNIDVMSRKLTGLKNEIGTRVKENISFINDTLSFINEIFSTLTKTGNSEVTYGKKRNFQNDSSNLIYNNEV